MQIPAQESLSVGGSIGVAPALFNNRCNNRYNIVDIPKKKKTLPLQQYPVVPGTYAAARLQWSRAAAVSCITFIPYRDIASTSAASISTSKSLGRTIELILLWIHRIKRIFVAEQSNAIQSSWGVCVTMLLQCGRPVHREKTLSTQFFLPLGGLWKSVNEHWNKKIKFEAYHNKKAPKTKLTRRSRNQRQRENFSSIHC